jgi:hypothetical protein
MRQKHRVTQVQPALGVGEDVGEEDPLVDLRAVLVRLQDAGFARERARAARSQSASRRTNSPRFFVSESYTARACSRMKSAREARAAARISAAFACSAALRLGFAGSLASACAARAHDRAKVLRSAARLAMPE